MHDLGPPPSDLGVALHVKGVHLVEDERDGVLSYDADVSTHRRQLFTLKLDTTTQLLVLSQQLITHLSTTHINALHQHNQ